MIKQARKTFRELSLSMRGLWWLFLAGMAFSISVQAHHVLGRPSYALNEDSNTPPSMQVETQIGDYYVSYMVFPAFPRPGAPGRINLYATRIADGTPFRGLVRFYVMDSGWFRSRPPELLGEQVPEDGVYRQGFQIDEEGDYILRAEFQADGQPYQIDFPLRIGNPVSLSPIGLAVGVIVSILVIVNLLQRRRLVRLKARRRIEEAAGDP